MICQKNCDPVRKREDYAKAETGLVDDLMSSRGNSSVVIYLKDVKAMKKLPPAYQVHIEDSWLKHMCEKYGSSNVKNCGQSIEKLIKNAINYIRICVLQ